MAYTVESILSVLDRSAEAFVFPMLDNGYVYLAATRLSLFRSAEDWALVFEVFGFSPRAGSPDLAVTTIGSRVQRVRSAADFVSDEAWDDYLAYNPFWEQAYFHPVEDEDWIDADDGERVSAAAVELTLRGAVTPVPSVSDYAEADVSLTCPPSVMVYELCRALASRHRDAVLATAAERRAALPDGPEPLAVLDGWNHPDVVDREKLPSRSPTLRALARALATGSFDAGATGSDNTHWSNWPDGGTL